MLVGKILKYVAHALRLPISDFHHHQGLLGFHAFQHPALQVPVKNLENCIILFSGHDNAFKIYHKINKT